MDVRIETGEYYTSLSYYGDGEDMHEFHENYQPLELPKKYRHCEWLRFFYCTPGELISTTDTDNKKKALDEAFRELQSRHPSLDVQKSAAAAKRLAVNHGVLDGKWYWFVPLRDVNKWWRIITRAIVSGDLPAKEATVEITSSNAVKDCRMMGVYNEDFRKADEVVFLKSLIRKLKLKVAMFYRPRYYAVVDVEKFGVQHRLLTDVLEGQKKAEKKIKEDRKMKRPMTDRVTKVCVWGTDDYSDYDYYVDYVDCDDYDGYDDYNAFGISRPRHRNLRRCVDV